MRLPSLYTAVSLSLLLITSYYSAPNGAARRQEIIDLWQPVVNRLPVKRNAKPGLLRPVRQALLQLILGVVTRLVVIRIGYAADNQGLFTLPDGEAALPIPKRSRADVDLFLRHYRYANDAERMKDYQLDEIRPRWAAVLFDADENVRNNILISIALFASMLPWARRDPVGMATTADELLERAISLRDGIMQRPSPIIHVLIFIFGNLSKPDDPAVTAAILDKFGRRVCEFQEVWNSRTFGLKASYRGDNMATYLSTYYNFTGELETTYLRRYLNGLVESRNIEQLDAVFSAISGSVGLVEMEIFPNRSPYVFLHYLSHALQAVRQLRSQTSGQEVSNDRIIEAFVHLKHLDPIATLSLLDEQPDDLITEWMKQRIVTARRSPRISTILVTVVSWFATTAVAAEDPTGRETFANFLRFIVLNKSLPSAGVDFMGYYLSEPGTVKLPGLDGK